MKGNLVSWNTTVMGRLDAALGIGIHQGDGYALITHRDYRHTVNFWYNPDNYPNFTVHITRPAP